MSKKTRIVIELEHDTHRYTVKTNPECPELDELFYLCLVVGSRIAEAKLKQAETAASALVALCEEILGNKNVEADPDPEPLTAQELLRGLRILGWHTPMQNTLPVEEA